jgi:hypothetical protein
MSFTFSAMPAATLWAVLLAGTPWLDVFCPDVARAGRSICAQSTVTH